VLRKLMESLGPELAALNFEDCSYLDANGQPRPVIRFSANVLANMQAVIDGKRLF
jgi:hypothetical protein